MVTEPKQRALPKWVHPYIQRDDLAAVAAAVRNAEVKTGAEIVPIIVRSSAVSGHIPAILILVYIVVITTSWALIHPFAGGHWSLAVIVVVLAVLFLQLSRLPAILRWLTDDDDLESQALARAELEFYRMRMRETASGTGVLLFISLAEHEAVVLADKAVSEKLPRDTWKKVCDMLVAAAKKKTLGKGLVDAITECGELCAPLFPPVGTNPNELSDALIIKD